MDFINLKKISYFQFFFYYLDNENLVTFMYKLISVLLSQKNLSRTLFLLVYVIDNFIHFFV